MAKGVAADGAAGDKAAKGGKAKDGPFKDKEVKLKATTLDAAILASARFRHAAEMSTDNMMAFLVAMLMHVIACSLQFTILILFRMITLGEVEAQLYPIHTKHMLLEQKMLVLKNNPADLLTKGGITGMCTAQESHPAIHYMMLVIWYATIIPTIVENYEKFVTLLKIPFEGDDAPVEYGEELKVVEVTKEKKGKETKVKVGYTIRHMSVGWKLAVCAIFLIPHTLLTLYTAWVGSKFLSLTSEVSMLLMKAMIMKVIATIHKKIFILFAADDFKKYCAASVYLTREEKEKAGTEVWMHTIKMVGFSVVFAMIYYNVFWGELMEYRVTCSEFFALYPEQKCAYALYPGNTCGLRPMSIFS